MNDAFRATVRAAESFQKEPDARTKDGIVRGAQVLSAFAPEPGSWIESSLIAQEHERGRGGEISVSVRLLPTDEEPDSTPHISLVWALPVSPDREVEAELEEEDWSRLPAAIAHELSKMDRLAEAITCRVDSEGW